MWFPGILFFFKNINKSIQISTTNMKNIYLILVMTGFRGKMEKISRLGFL